MNITFFIYIVSRQTIYYKPLDLYSLAHYPKTMVEKEIIVLGDIEMGAGNLTDDFISDNALSDLILELHQRPHPIDLILNGDVFDFLKCPYFKNNQLIYTRHVTEEVSLSKLKLIYKAHQRVFNSLRKYVRNKKHRLYFIVGNHDMDLVYKGVQKEIRELLGKKRNIYFKMKYNQHNVYTEHGNQYDFLNRFSAKRLFLYHKKNQILNLPWVNFSLMSTFMNLKEEHPFAERITPKPTLLDLHKAVKKKFTKTTVKQFLKGLFYYPIRYFFDPTYSYPKELISEIYRRVKKTHFDIDKIVNVFKLKKWRIVKKNKILILSHDHEKYIEDKDGRVIIHPGSWRDEYKLNKETRELTPNPKRYVQIIVGENELNYQLIDYHIKRSILKLDDVIKDEIKFIKLAAKEEKFTLSLI
jgi:UDP-2,3-diacylglucosamine pyrophosphatase LpxH